MTISGYPLKRRDFERTLSHDRSPSSDWPGDSHLFDGDMAADHLDFIFGRNIGWVASIVRVREDLIGAPDMHARASWRWRFIAWPRDRGAYLADLTDLHLTAIPTEHLLYPVLLRSPELSADNLQRARVAWAWLPDDNVDLLLDRVEAVAPQACVVRSQRKKTLEVVRTLEARLSPERLTEANADLAHRLGAKDEPALISFIRLAGTSVHDHQGSDQVRFERPPPPELIDRYVDLRPTRSRNRLT